MNNPKSVKNPWAITLRVAIIGSILSLSPVAWADGAASAVNVAKVKTDKSEQVADNCRFSAGLLKAFIAGQKSVPASERMPESANKKNRDPIVKTLTKFVNHQCGESSGNKNLKSEVIYHG